MVVGTEDIDSLVEAACHELIVVVSDIGDNVGGDTVCPDEYEILVSAEISCPEPCGTVLLVGMPRFSELFNDLPGLSAVVESAFTEPVVVLDAVLSEVTFKSLDVYRERISDECLSALFFVETRESVAVYVKVILGVFDDISAEVYVLGHLKPLTLSALGINCRTNFFCIAAIFRDDSLSVSGGELHIAERERFSEFLYLIARVIDIEFAFSLVACPVKNACKAVADSAAACISDVHRTCRVSGYELNEYTLSGACFGASVVRAFVGYTFKNVRKPLFTEEEVDESRTGGLTFFKR